MRDNRPAFSSQPHHKWQPILAHAFVGAITLILSVCGGCRSTAPVSAPMEDAMMRIAPTETVMLRRPLGVERKYWRFFEDQRLWVRLAIRRPDSLYEGACCRLDVIIVAEAELPGTEVRFNGKKARLQVGTDPVQVVAPYRQGGDWWTAPWPGADLTLFFDLKRFDLTQRNSSPMRVRLDSVLTCNKQLIDLGQIEVHGLASDTAEYTY